MSNTVQLPQTPSPFQYQAALKAFVNRGGAVNGLNPTVVGKVWFVNPQAGADGNNGLSPDRGFETMARAFEFVANNDIIVLTGVVREQLVAPTGVFDVTIVGSVVTPRQATDGGVATGGGATWLPPATGAVATTPLLQLVAQGWTLVNLQMSPHTASACVRLTRTALLDASHAAFINCYFSGGGVTPIGIEDNGGCGFVQVLGCRFQNLTSAILSLNTAQAIPLSWKISDGRFQQNTNDVKMSLSYAIIERNRFMTAGAGAVNKVISTTFIAAQGGNNQVLLNQFSNTEAEIAPATGYTGAASDTWMNYVNNQAALAFGLPA